MKKFKFLAPIILVCCVCVCSCAKKPWLYENVKWVSENPVIEVQKDSNGAFVGNMIVDTESVEIVLIWGGSSSFSIYNLNDYMLNESIVDLDKYLIQGRVEWNTLKDNKKAILKIADDKVFFNKYDKIVLRRTMLDRQ